MGVKDPRVDAYIVRSAPFAKPILKHLRELIHKNCPTVEETIKWSFPHFCYKGPNDRSARVLCSMASFKEHCAFGFWHEQVKASLDPNRPAGTAMGQYGRISSLADLPGDKILAKQIKEAVKLHDAGPVKLARRPRPTGKQELKIPSDLNAALQKNRKAKTTFDGFSYTNKREYVEWITDAKSDETRARRLATAVEWMSEGKVRNWKYVRG